MRLAGIEPATLGLEGRCSIRLSYRRVKDVHYGVDMAAAASAWARAALAFHMALA